MSETIPTSAQEQPYDTRKRNLIILATIIPLAAFFSLLGWGIARSGGTPGGLGINNSFGEVSVEQQRAPDFLKNSLAGEPVSLSELNGKVVMVDFWSSWCPPCRREAPTLAQVYREYDDEDIQFIGVAIWDDPGDVSGYIQEFDLSYPTVMDEKGLIAIDYGVMGIPEKFFIDAQGNLVRKYVGPMGPDDLRTALNELLLQ